MKLNISIFSVFIFLCTFYCDSQITDYSKLDAWAVTPNNPPAVLNDYIKDSTLIRNVDVFYVYPTLFLDKNDQRWNIPLSDEEQRKKVVENAVRFQSSAWAEAGRLFVPFYQQAHIRSYRLIDEGGRDALLKAYTDVRTAFEYYLKHHNNGRPIILAGHSQGATHLTLLLKDYFDNKPLQKQLVAAYLPGIGITEEDFENLCLMTKANETGGFVCWNTFKKKINHEKYDKWYKGKAVVNPVTWDLSQKAPRTKHKGFLFSNNKVYKSSFNTHLIDGAIWISTPHFPYRSMAWTMDDYHIGDVNLFWEDIRENAKLRAKTYIKNNGK
jgi:hypothetical protein